jgi:hypothetical protein
MMHRLVPLAEPQSQSSKLRGPAELTYEEFYF